MTLGFGKSHFKTPVVLFTLCGLIFAWIKFRDCQHSSKILCGLIFVNGQA